MNLALKTHFWGTGSEWFWAFWQFVAIAVTLALIYWRQVRVQRASHIVQSISTINTRWNSESMLRARSRVCTRWLDGNKEFDGVAQYVAEYMEELGNYLRIHAVSTRQMWEAQSWYVEHYYWMFKKGMEDYRQTYMDETLFSQFEKLFKKMNKKSKNLGAPNSEKRKTELDAFAKNELVVAGALLKLKLGSESTIDNPIKTNTYKRNSD